jgi:hypothetical protein
MSDSEIPANLIALQRALFAAQAEVRAASRPEAEDDPAELNRLRQVEREAAVALNRARTGTEFADYRQQGRLEDAAREG